MARRLWPMALLEFDSSMLNFVHRLMRPSRSELDAT
jgi:hypothetical protein